MKSKSTKNPGDLVRIVSAMKGVRMRLIKPNGRAYAITARPRPVEKNDVLLVPPGCRAKLQHGKSATIANQKKGIIFADPGPTETEIIGGDPPAWDDEALSSVDFYYEGETYREIVPIGEDDESVIIRG